MTGPSNPFHFYFSLQNTKDMPKIPKDIIEKIMETAVLVDVISDFVELSADKKTRTGKCPMCDADGKGKGLKVTPAKNMFKCFSCDWGGNSPVKFLQDTQKMTYLQAIEYLAKKYAIDITDQPAAPKQQQKKNVHTSVPADQESYCFKMLRASGLTESDVTIKEYVDDKQTRDKVVYQKGSLDQYGQIIESGDDIIIWYYDLEGKPVKFQKPKSSSFANLFRVRWQNPGLHPDKNGRPVKYKSPVGSGSHIYWPEPTRNAYRLFIQFDTLYIQEGEKKADKASKHGLLSCGVMGIHNIASEGKLPFEIQLIVQRCKVKNVVFVLDSDWDHLNDVLLPNARAELRISSFYSAIRNFKDYFRGFANSNIYVDTYFAHVKSDSEKGIDDLLAGSMVGKEHELLSDFEFAMNEKSGVGTNVNCYKISQMPDAKLMEFWCIQNIDAFVGKYRARLQEMPEFKFGRHLWKLNAEGKPELSQPLNDDEIFWETIVDTDGRGREKIRYQFDYENAYNFLRNRGYGLILMANGVDEFVHISNQIVQAVAAKQIKDYVMQLARDLCPKTIRNLLYRGAKMYFGPESLGNLQYFDPHFVSADKNYQYFFFSDKYWKITAESIEEKAIGELEGYVWQDNIIEAKPTLLNDDMVKIQRIDQNFISSLPANQQPEFKNHIGQFHVLFTEAARDCHFLNFLYNTSEFFWRDFLKIELDENGHHVYVPRKTDRRSIAMKLETNMHFLSKMTAIGYLLHRFRDKTCEKAVIAMDGKLSEVGESHGRTGKSLIGVAIANITSQAYISGKNPQLTEDKFIFEEVTEKTGSIFIDDVRANIDFEFFFPTITGQITVNVKSMKKFTLPKTNSAKILITTNHSIVSNSPSDKDRKAEIAFSDYYNEAHKPLDDFHCAFFTEWEADQFNLFYNFFARCMQLYFQYGLINPPSERLERRRMRQFIGEDFLIWCDSYFGLSDDILPDDSDSGNINKRLVRIELFDDFKQKNPNQIKFVTPHRFKKKILCYCDFRGLRFNPQCTDKDGKPGADDKSSGVEYFTLANSKYGQVEPSGDSDFSKPIQTSF